MDTDKDFKPKLGKIGAKGGKRGTKYLHRVLRAIALAGGPARKASRFSGVRMGRGAGIGRVLASRDQYAAFRQRRVVIKSRIVRIKTNAGKGRGAQVHLRYIQRDGVTREGTPGDLYDARSEQADGKAFLERGLEDRHQFRFIVAPEDADQYPDLKPYIRRVMEKMEQDLGTKLDWVAVDHFNTGHPHTHIILRGKDDLGKDLIIARDYMSAGMRERASEIVSLDLGPRTTLEIESRLSQEVEQERFTSLDRKLLKEVDQPGLVRPHTIADTFQQTLRSGRLQKLRRLGLAEELEPGYWRLPENLEATLRGMGLRGDIIKTMHRELRAKGLSRMPADCTIYDPHEDEARHVIGRVVVRGLSDELNDRHYLVIDGTDGFSHYVDIGKAEDTEPLPEGAIVALSPKRAAARDVDRTVAEIAAANAGRYSLEIHLGHDSRAKLEFAETHVRRLEAIRKLSGGVEREQDGTWVIAPDHIVRATAYERKHATNAPVIVETLSRFSLAQQVSAEGSTWLDQELVARTPIPLRNAGFGKDTREALARRQQWLMERELAHMDQDRVIYRANLLGTLRRRDLARTAQQLSKELGLTYAEKSTGQRIEGVYRRPVDLVSGRFALIEGVGKEFNLVPWRPVLDRSLGQEVSGVVRDGGISWTLGRSRGLSR